MTIIPVSALSRIELHRLGNNLAAAAEDDQQDLDAINRSLSPLGESWDTPESDPPESDHTDSDAQIESALRSEEVAG